MLLIDAHNNFMAVSSLARELRRLNSQAYAECAKSYPTILYIENEDKLIPMFEVVEARDALVAAINDNLPTLHEGKVFGLEPGSDSRYGYWDARPEAV